MKTIAYAITFLAGRIGPAQGTDAHKSSAMTQLPNDGELEKRKPGTASRSKPPLKASP